MKGTAAMSRQKLTVRQKLWKCKELYLLLLLPLLYFLIFRYGTFIWLVNYKSKFQFA